MTKHSPHPDVAAAMALHRAGDLAGAQAAYRAVLDERPDDADALHLLGLALHQQGNGRDGAALIARAVALDPARPTFRFNAATVYLALDRLEDAAAAYEAATRLAPDNVNAWLGLATVRGRMADYDGALAAFDGALARAPAQATGLSGRAAALNGLRRYDEGLAAAERALGEAPDLAEAHLNKGNALRNLGRYVEAEAAFSEASRLSPADPSGPYNLGNLYQDWGRLDEAAAAFDAALARQPDHDLARANRLMCELYREGATERSLFDAHRAWGLAVAGDDPQPPPSAPRAGRPLRVGYVSPDFRRHSCAYFIEPVLARHDPRRVEVFCYSDVRRPDDTTARLRGLAAHWRDVAGQGDDAVMDRIAADGIDVLVDLAGHTTNNRLRLFARRAAPLQVSWLGYPATTGLAQIGWRMTDAVADPPGDADAWHTETLVRLPSGFHCYRPPDDAPDVSPLPALAQGHVTFGSFNNLSKVTPATVAAWADILDAVAGSRLILKGRSLDGDGARDYFRAAFAARGIAADRLTLLGWIDRDDGPLGAYRDVDVGLDPFPYNGTTTTCEALWMGVPVVTLNGGRHAARVGASLLRTLGHAEWIAETPEAYRDVAISLAGDLEALAVRRGRLRGEMAASPLRDEAGFTRQLEDAFLAIAAGETPGPA